MADPRGIAINISSRRPVYTDDPEYDKLLLALHAEQPDALQENELARVQTLLPANFQSQNDPVADRARLGVPDGDTYTSTFEQFLGRQAPVNLKQSVEDTVFAPAVNAVSSVFGALDRPPTSGYPEGVPYTSPLRLISAAGAAVPATVGVLSDLLRGAPTPAGASVVDPMRAPEDQATFQSETAKRGGGTVAQTLGTLADLFVGPEHGLQAVGAALPLVLGAGKITKLVADAKAARALTGGFYSRVDEAAKMLPAKGVKAESLINTLKKASGGVNAEELELRNLAEFAASKRGQVVTPADLAAHLKANPAPFPTVKTLGGENTWSKEFERAWSNGELGSRKSWGGTTRPSRPDDFIAISERLERIARISSQSPMESDRLFRLSEEAGRLAEGINPATGSTAGQPKFSQYQVPGGENYRETLLKLPAKPSGSFENYARRYREIFDANKTDAEIRVYWKAGHTLPETGNITSSRDPNMFVSSHYSDDPNLVAHTRSNERTSPTGERGTFLEEVQSDWHQRGKEKGYQDPSAVAAMHEAEQNLTVARKQRADEYEKFRDMSDLLGNPNYDDTPPELVQQLLKWKEASKLQDEADNIYRAAVRQTGGVPDAPFKENWSDLSLKQALIDEANRSPDPGFLGATGGKTQINRWGTERLAWEPMGKTGYSQRPTFRVSFEPQVGGNAAGGNMGEEALRRGLIQNSLTTVHSLEELTQLLGGSEVKAEKAWKRMMAKPEGGLYQPRAEGMTEFYDKQLPAKLEKILKPFGGTVEQGKILGVPLERQHTGRGRIVEYPQPEPAWLARLTPEMKARILKEGLPLMGLSGLTLGSLLGDQTQETR